MKKIATATLIFLFSFALANSQDEEYTKNSIARLSFLTGNTYIQKAADLGYEEGVINMPITQGDRVGTTEGRAEIHIGQGNYIRLDHNTKVDFEKLPSAADKLIQLQIWSGNVYLSIMNMEREKEIEVHTADVSIYVLDTGLYRIDVRPAAETEVFVFNGLVEAAGEAGSILIKDEQRIEAAQGYFTTRPTRFFAVANDSFDRWSENRDTQIQKYLANRYLPEELTDFEYELYEYGDWVYVFPYGWVWVPRGTSPAWRPYYYGRWLWLPICGWTWLPYESWGWVTFHFGYWHWSPFHGWYWIPGSVWGPGWVSWYWGADYIGWAPMSYWGYPGVIINNVYYGNYSGYYPPESKALTVIHKNQLKAQNISKVALAGQSTRTLGNIRLGSSSPPYRPVPSSVLDSKDLEGKQILLKRSGSPTVLQEEKSLPSPSAKARDSQITDREMKQTPRSIKKPDDSNTRKFKNYPPSPKIGSQKEGSSRSTSKPSSIISRIYDRITKTSGTIRSGSSRSSSSKGSSSGSGKISSRSGSSSSRSATGRSSSSKSSSKGSGSRIKK